MTQGRLRVVAATPISDELIARVVELEPRIDFIADQSLLAPMRHPGDHQGDPAFERTPEQQAAFEALIDSADVLYGVPDETPSALARAVAANPGLRWVQTMPAGGGAQVKAAELDSEQLERVAFSTSAGVHAAPLAEFSIFGLLAGAKSLPRLQSLQRDRVWGSRWTMGLLSQQTILVVGLGSIGRETARLLAQFGARVIGTSRHETSVEHVDEVVVPSAIADVAGRIDGVVVTLPGTSATEKLVGSDFFAALKPGATLVSVGRGTVIDEEAMIAALEDGRVGFAALDVVAEEPLERESPLWTHPHVLISPHTAALNSAEDRLIAELFARNATRFLDGEPLINRVDTVEFY
ncbi:MULTISPECIES: D-2-hydroxyacid dehydrogenase [unclassified Rathayibacter]|uniref:D-2-hydroxyacid dehydrogenase n=1 Tax=unclassified Rathayibacter TaxID=2609250 RepID=UPI0006F545EA|nr:MULTISPECIES: D-2-hydroxyacid dehydrogenase [unclassified Rathayibacter]KQQ05744.1 hydroxyacid dehydrogenase [Rathayibacter sp. Leaf294]KQS13602.1 hydroxyacid dehydrogenase [Rathayibacter sp. Leaf185]